MLSWRRSWRRRRPGACDRVSARGRSVRLHCPRPRHEQRMPRSCLQACRRAWLLLPQVCGARRHRVAGRRPKRQGHAGRWRRGCPGGASAAAAGSHQPQHDAAPAAAVSGQPASGARGSRLSSIAAASIAAAAAPASLRPRALSHAFFGLHSPPVRPPSCKCDARPAAVSSSTQGKARACGLGAPHHGMWHSAHAPRATARAVAGDELSAFQQAFGSSKATSTGSGGCRRSQQPAPGVLKTE